MNDFYVGQKVVCIAQGNWANTKKLKINHPVKGMEYTVRDVYEATDGEVGLRLFEIVNKPMKLDNGKNEEIGFSASEFRPLSNKQHDISALIQLAQTISTKIH